MGKSLPPPASIDLVTSYARVHGGDVELVMTGTGRIRRRDPFVVLTKGKRRVRGPVQVISLTKPRRCVARVPRQQLTDGVWSITLRPGGGPRPVGARLLVQGARPVVLLWGAEEPASRRPEPYLARHPELGVRQLAPSLFGWARRRLASTGAAPGVGRPAT